jgi:hypothetical protein
MNFKEQQIAAEIKGEEIANGQLTIVALGGFATSFDYMYSPSVNKKIIKSSVIDDRYAKQLVAEENEYRLIILRMINDFLKALQESQCMVAIACKVSGLTRSHAIKLRNKIPAFDELWTEIYDDVTDVIENTAYKRAVEGIEEPVYYKGDLVDTKLVYSDSLLTLLLQSRRPEVYKQRAAIEAQPVGTFNFQMVMAEDDNVQSK